MSNQFRVTKLEDVLEPLPWKELRATSFMSIALKGTAHSDTVEEVLTVKIYKVHRAEVRC